MSSTYTITTAEDTDQVLALRDDWQKMPLDPNADMDFYLTVLQSGNQIMRPHVIVLKQDGVVQSILVGRLETKPFEVALGYKKLSSPPIRILNLIHGGVLGKDSEDHASALIDSVKKSLKNNEADVAWFYGLELDSAFYRVARNAGGFLTHDHCPVRMRRWRIQLPASYEELYRQRSANTRHNLKRYSKRLRDAFGDQLSVRSFRNPGDVETILSDTEIIASKTYHRGLGVGFLGDDVTQQLMRLAANQGWLRAHILYIGGKPVAFWNGLLYRRTFFTWTTGYDPDLSDYRPGMFLLQRMLEELCGEKAADEVDFGFGDAQYKKDWCDHERLQASLFLFAPTVKGILLNSVRSSLLGASNGARTLLERTGALPKLKKAWRSRAVSRPMR
jgi:hypothetical protein